MDLQDRCVVVKTGTDDEVRYTDHFEWQPNGYDLPLTIEVESLFAGIQGKD